MSSTMVGAGSGLAEGLPTDDQSHHGRLAELQQWADFLISGAPESDQAANVWAEIVARWIVDASTVWDVEALEQGLRTLQKGYTQLPLADRHTRLAGMVAALAEVAGAAFGRAVQAAWEQSVEPSSHAARMLLLIGKRPEITGPEIAECLGVDPSQVSRSGGQLIERGLAGVTPLGRARAWRLTPRGEHAELALRRRGVEFGPSEITADDPYEKLLSQYSDPSTWLHFVQPERASMLRIGDWLGLDLPRSSSDKQIKARASDLIVLIGKSSEPREIEVDRTVQNRVLTFPTDD